jgi:SAM-dependent methyltransferase
MTAPIDNPVRGRLNAAFFRLMDRYVHFVLGDRKQQLLADLPDTVVEIGPGAGTNLRYYRPGTTLIAVEPNVHMHGRLRRAAARRHIRLDLLPVGAEDTGLRAGSVDAVVCTLVLCTVPDPAAVLAEVRRLLRPGGRLLFVEHVGAPQRSALGLLQRLLHPLWRWCFEGCELRRHTAGTLEAADFRAIDLEHYRLRSAFLPVNAQIAGTATA